MKNIGKRIKDLRKKNDLTQEKLADLLGVTYKSVSKWECGLTTPDLAMIVPLARVLHVSADELLGMKPTEQDERKAYFDAEYDEFWKKEDHKADYLLAKQAVKEYPEEYKYWHWLGTVEYYLSFDQKPEEFMEWIDNSIKHNLIAFENGDSEDCKDCALWDIICAYRYSNRIEEAKKYAELFPEILQRAMMLWHSVLREKNCWHINRKCFIIRLQNFVVYFMKCTDMEMRRIRESELVWKRRRK